MARPDRVTRLIRVIGIYSELKQTTNAKRRWALCILLADASSVLTKSDHERIHMACLQAFAESTKLKESANTKG